MNCIKTPAPSREITKKQDRAFFMCCLQVFSSVASLLVYFFFRRVKLILIFSILVFVLSFLGLKGAVQLRKSLIAVHGFTTTTFYGGFFIYLLIDFAFSKSAESDIGVLLGVCVPFLVDFVSGCFSVSLIVAIWNYEEQSVPDFQVPFISSAVRDSQDSCLICNDRPKEVVIVPCGHKCLCVQCGGAYRSHYFLCPICRNRIRDIIFVYE